MSLVGDAFVTAGRADAMAPSATIRTEADRDPAADEPGSPRTVDAYTPSSTGTARIAMRSFRNTGPGCVGGERTGWGLRVARIPLGRMRPSG